MIDNPEIIEVKPKNKGGRPRKYKSVRQMTMAINRYFTDDVIPTKAGLAYFLGFCSKDALNLYEGYEEFTDLITRTFLRIERFWTENLAKTNCSGSAFWLKNNAGYTDKQTIVTKNEAPELTEAEKTASAEAAKVYKLRMAQ